MLVIDQTIFFAQMVNKYFFLGPKCHHASSRFLIERIGLGENTLVSQKKQKSSNIIKGKWHRRDSRMKSQVQDLRGDKRHFSTHFLLPRPFDVSSVKGSTNCLSDLTSTSFTQVEHVLLKKI